MTAINTLYLSLISRKMKSDKNKVSISINIRVSGIGVKRVSTGMAIPSTSFRDGKITGRTSPVVAAEKSIQLLMKKITESYWQLMEKNMVPYPQLIIDNFLSSSKEEMSLMKLAEQICFQKESATQTGQASHHLPEKFRVLKSQLSDFIKIEYRKQDIFLYEIGYDFITKFVLFLKSPIVGNGNVTVNKKVSNLGQLFNYALKNDWIKKNPLAEWKPLSEPDTNKEFLTEPQFRQLLEFKLPNPTYEVVKDTFIFMCMTGMAFSDMKAFNLSKIKEIDGIMFIQYERSKNGSFVMVPATPQLLEIINRHFMKPKIVKRRDSVMKDLKDPVFSAQGMKIYNEKIKTLFEYNDIELDFIMSSHSARKTFGNLINKYMGMSDASQMLGHSSIRTTEKNYVDNASMEMLVKRSGLMKIFSESLFNKNKL